MGISEVTFLVSQSEGARVHELEGNLDRDAIITIHVLPVRLNVSHNLLHAFRWSTRRVMSIGILGRRILLHIRSICWGLLFQTGNGWPLWYSHGWRHGAS